MLFIILCSTIRKIHSKDMAKNNVVLSYFMVLLLDFLVFFIEISSHIKDIAFSGIF